MTAFPGVDSAHSVPSAHGTSILPEWIRTVAGLAAAVGAAVLLFSSGLAAMDHLQAVQQNSVTLRAGTFATDRQTDYGEVTSPRLPAQRPAR